MISQSREIACPMFWRKKLHALILVLSIPGMALFGVGCNIGGTGTDTENGLRERGGNNNFDAANPNFESNHVSLILAQVLDSMGRPVSGVTFTARETYFRPDSLETKPLLTLVSRDNKQKTVISNAKGEVQFKTTQTGIFVLEGIKSGLSLFYDTLRVFPNQAEVKVTYTVGPRRILKGKVKLTSGMHIDSGKVFIQGTQRFVKIDGDGAYNLGDLPISVERMGLGIRFKASPSKVIEVNSSLVFSDVVLDKPRTQNTISDTLELVYTCKDLPPDSSAKITKPLLSSAPNSNPLDSLRPVDLAQKKIDSLRVSLALNSCDSIPGGALVNFKPTDPKRFTLPANVGNPTGTFLVTGEQPNAKMMKDQVVSYPLCVESPGSEKTIFAIALNPSVTGDRDLVVQDLSNACRNP